MASDNEPIYVIVTDPSNEEPVELPTSEDGSLSLVTLEHAFPGAHGLKFKNPATGASRALLLDSSGTKFLPPVGGWDGKVFTIVLRPPTSDESEAKKRKRTVESDNGEVNDSEDGDSCSEDGGEKRKKSKRRVSSEDKAICSDLIVLGLPYKLSDAELKDYFSQFGTVVLCEVKTNSKGDSRGFGFIQMSDYAEQIRVLSKPNHLIGGRKCQVRMPLSKNGEVREPNLILNPKLFVTRVPEKATVDRLNEFFTEHAHKVDAKCTVLDVYIPKPFRGFAFVTLSSPAVAKELISQGDLIFDGTSIAITAAAPRESLPKSKPRPYSATYPVARPGGNHFSDNMRPGPRNGPVGMPYDRFTGNDYGHTERFFDNGPKTRYDWRDSASNHMPPTSRYYDNERSRNSAYLDERNQQSRNAPDDSVLGMNPEVVTAAFKAFLSAAQQSIGNNTGGVSGVGGNSRNGNGAGPYVDDLAVYDNGALNDGGAGVPQWR